MNKLLKTAGAALLAGTMAMGVPAVASEGPYLGGFFSGYLLDEKRFEGGSSEESLVGGLQLGIRSGPWAVDGGYGTYFMGQKLDVAKADVYYYLGSTHQNWTPYIVGGLSYFELDEPNRVESEGYTWQASGGVGLSHMFQNNWEFRGDARLVQKVKNGRSNTTDLALTFGLNYYFNPPAPQVVSEPAPAPVRETPPETRTISVRLNVEFEFDKAVVRAIYGDEIAAVANAMRNQPDIELVLEGHTCSIGTEEYNQGLSERRVAAVKERIVQDYGIDPNRITTVGYGETRPIADNSTEEGRARNRRVMGEVTFTEVVRN